MSARVVWATHPRHLPSPPRDRVVVVDVAFAAGQQFYTKTKPFLVAVDERLVAWVDHHEHREAWPRYANDARFVLVPNKIAHACPELVTPELVERAEGARGRAETIVAHADFDGCVAAAKWLLRGAQPWPEADEDARAVDSPGRGHALSTTGTRLSAALDEASARFDLAGRAAFLDRLCAAIVARDEDLGLADEIDTLARAARTAEDDAARIAEAHGREEARDVFVVRVDAPIDNRMRRNLLLAGEARARIGALYEPDKEGTWWLIAATFDVALDLEDVAGFAGGRSDYRFARAKEGGHALVQALSDYSASRPR